MLRIMRSGGVLRTLLDGCGSGSGETVGTARAAQRSTSTHLPSALFGPTTAMGGYCTPRCHDLPTRPGYRWSLLQLFFLYICFYYVSMGSGEWNMSHSFHPLLVWTAARVLQVRTRSATQLLLQSRSTHPSLNLHGKILKFSSL